MWKCGVFFIIVNFNIIVPGIAFPCGDCSADLKQSQECCPCVGRNLRAIDIPKVGADQADNRDIEADYKESLNDGVDLASFEEDSNEYADMDDQNINADESPDEAAIATPEGRSANSENNKPLAPDMAGKGSVIYSTIAAADPCPTPPKKEPKPIFRPEVNFAQSMIQHIREANEANLNEARKRAATSPSGVKTGLPDSRLSVNPSRVASTKPADLTSTSTSQKSGSLLKSPDKTRRLLKNQSLGENSGASSGLSLSKVPAPEGYPRLKSAIAPTRIRPLKTSIDSLRKNYFPKPILKTSIPKINPTIQSAKILAKSMAATAPARMKLLQSVGDSVANRAVNKVGADVNRLNNKLRLSQEKLAAKSLLPLNLKGALPLRTPFVRTADKPIVPGININAVPKLDPNFATGMIESASNLVNSKINLISALAAAQPVESINYNIPLYKSNAGAIPRNNEEDIFQAGPKLAKGFVDSTGNFVQNKLSLISKLADSSPLESKLRTVPKLNVKNTAFDPVSRAIDLGAKAEADTLRLAPKFAKGMTDSLSNLVHKNLVLIGDLANNPSLKNSLLLENKPAFGSFRKASRNDRYRLSDGIEGNNVMDFLHKMRKGIFDVLVGPNADNPDSLATARDAQESPSFRSENVYKPQLLQNSRSVDISDPLQQKIAGYPRIGRIEKLKNRCLKRPAFKTVEIDPIPNIAAKPLSIPRLAQLSSKLDKIKKLPEARSADPLDEVNKASDCKARASESKAVDKPGVFRSKSNDEEVFNCKLVCKS